MSHPMTVNTNIRRDRALQVTTSTGASSLIRGMGAVIRSR